MASPSTATADRTHTEANHEEDKLVSANSAKTTTVKGEMIALPVEVWALVVLFASPDLRVLHQLSQLFSSLRTITWGSALFKSYVLRNQLAHGNAGVIPPKPHHSSSNGFISAADGRSASSSSSHSNPTEPNHSTNHSRTDTDPPSSGYPAAPMFLSFFRLPDARLILRHLVESGHRRLASVDSLHLAIRLRHSSMIRVLLESGVPPTVRCLHRAVETGTVESVEMIVGARDRWRRCRFHGECGTGGAAVDSCCVTAETGYSLVEGAPEPSIDGVEGTIESSGPFALSRWRDEETVDQRCLVIAAGRGDVEMVRAVLSLGRLHFEEAMQLREENDESEDTSDLQIAPFLRVENVEDEQTTRHGRQRDVDDDDMDEVSVRGFSVPTILEAAMFAAERGYPNVLKLFFDEIESMSRHAILILRRAVLFGQRAVVETIIGKVESVGETVPGHVITPMIEIAAREGRGDIIDLLLNWLATNTPNLESSLHLAVVNGHAGATSALLSHRISHMAENGEMQIVDLGCTPTRVAYATAISADRIDILELLLRRTAYLGGTTPQGVLSYAVDGGHLGCLDLLSAYGHEITPSDLLFAARALSVEELKTSRTPHASQTSAGVPGTNSPQTASESTQQTATVGSSSASSHKAGSNAVRQQILVSLVRRGSRDCAEQALVMAVQGGDAFTVGRILSVLPLDHFVSDAAVTGAVLLGDAVTLRLLLEHRANAIRTIATKAPHTEWGEVGFVESTHKSLTETVPPIALTLAADAGCLSSVQILLQFGANPTPSDVYVAAQRGRPDLVRVLVAVNPLKLSMPPLELAMRRGDAEIVSTLLDSGIEPGIVGLAFAVESGSVEVVRKLLIHTSDTMVATASGTPRSPAAGVVMARAIRDGRLMDVKTLTEAGLSVTSADIYMAARTGSVVIVAVLLSHCRLASTEEIDIGVTPLNLAVKEGDIVAVRTLTRCGVVPSRFALAAAVGSGREDILRILGACSATTAEHSTAVAGSPNSDAAHERDDLMHSFALNLAVDIGRANVVRTLLEIFPRMHVSLAVVMLAARRGDLDVIMSLLWRFEGSVNDLQQLSKEAETHQHLLAATVLDSLARSLSERS